MLNRLSIIYHTIIIVYYSLLRFVTTSYSMHSRPRRKCSHQRCASAPHPTRSPPPSLRRSERVGSGIAPLMELCHPKRTKTRSHKHPSPLAPRPGSRRRANGLVILAPSFQNDHKAASHRRHLVRAEANETNTKHHNFDPAASGDGAFEAEKTFGHQIGRKLYLT